MAGQFASGGASGTNGAPSTTGPSLDGAAAAHGPLQAVEFGESSAFAADPPMDRDAWSALAAMDDGRLTEEIHGVEAPVDAALAREWGRLIRNVATRMVLVKMRKDEEMAIHTRQEERQHQLLLQRQQEVEAQKQAEKEQRAQKLRELEERRVREREERIQDMEKIEEGNPLCGIFYYQTLARRLQALETSADAQLRSSTVQEARASPESVSAAPGAVDLLREEQEAVEEQERLQPESDQGYWADGGGKGDLDFGCLEEEDGGADGPSDPVPPPTEGSEGPGAGNGGNKRRGAMDEEEEDEEEGDKGGGLDKGVNREGGGL